MKKICILGSTGSVGSQCLEVIKDNLDKYKVEALAACSNIDLLEKQAHFFKPKIIAVYQEKHALELQKRLPNIKIVTKLDGLNEVASHPDVDFVLSSMTGSIGIVPTITAIKAKKQIGLANKEVLVAAGELVMQLVKENNVSLLPVDSEHSAIFQCLNGEKSEVKRIVLTASGGPFRKWSFDMLSNITKENALNHPNYNMGVKNTIDSSTLMNKGLEVIEAYYLFNIPISQIEVIVHPEQLIHGFVEYVDGSILAHLSKPDMKVPINYALSYPKRISLKNEFDFLNYSKLEFFKPDINKFICLHLAYEAIKYGKSMPCFINSANEVLVKRFVSGQISWLDIGRKLEKLMSSHRLENMLNLESILAVDETAKKQAEVI
jgi:1-deoxy-D-xylulose-5-phosphate reductoisomerase